ncbi:MAG: hypothetical protein ACRELA_08130 [Candidatus Rokuibacteriota bacterium]
MIRVGACVVLVVLGLMGELSWPPVLQACSAMLKPVEQVIEESELIVRAEVVGFRDGKAQRPGNVDLRVLEALKGSLTQPVISVEGRLRDYQARGETSLPYRQLNCARAGGCGGCFARDYRRGRQYLLLLKSGTPYWAPLAATNEEVSGESDPWVQWVKAHLAKTQPR